MTAVIVLFGVKGSGKDTVGDLLRDRYGFAKDAFAAPLKQMAKLAFPDFTDADLYGTSENRERQEPAYPMTGCPFCPGKQGFSETLVEKDPTLPRGVRCLGCGAHLPVFLNARIALQTLGTEWGRRLYPHVWVDACFSRVRAGDVERVVVTDGRFRNELDRSRDQGAFCVKLTRGLAQSTDPHPSEAEFRSIPDDAFNLVLDNANIQLIEMPVAIESITQAAGLPPIQSDQVCLRCGKPLPDDPERRWTNVHATPHYLFCSKGCADRDIAEHQHPGACESRARFLCSGCGSRSCLRRSDFDVPLIGDRT